MIFFELFAHNPTIIPVAAGQALFTAGEEGHLMFVLSKGTADVMVNGQVVEQLQHGSVVGEMGIVSPGPRSATVVATSDCEFVAVDEKRFQFLVQQTPFFATQVMRVMAERLRAVNQLAGSTAGHCSGRPGSGGCGQRPLRGKFQAQHAAIELRHAPRHGHIGPFARIAGRVVPKVPPGCRVTQNVRQRFAEDLRTIGRDNRSAPPIENFGRAHCG
mgnify:CR=1 FL=1